MKRQLIPTPDMDQYEAKRELIPTPDMDQYEAKRELIPTPDTDQYEATVNSNTRYGPMCTKNK